MVRACSAASRRCTRHRKPSTARSAKPATNIVWPSSTRSCSRASGLTADAGDEECQAAEQEEVSRLGITQAQPETGSLRPTVIIGVGSFGRRALRELRCRFLDHLGDLNKIPLLRFLYVDSDAEALQG